MFEADLPEERKRVARKALHEEAFQGWYKDWAKKTDISPDPDDPLHFYNYRAAYRAGEEPAKGEDGKYHWSSAYKRKGHPNLIVDGVNTKTGKKVKKKRE